MPVLPAGHNPHAGAQSAAIDEMQPWIDDALDLIEFANGEYDTKWGAVRAELGHSEPFNLEYIAIGNEETQDAFFERYTIMHNAIKEKYPEIKLINSAGPFCAGDAYEKGWHSSIMNNSDLIDEHYYQAPEWFIANHHRYDKYEGKTKVFVGEYASKGSKWRNALAEASYMIGLEKNAHAVGLACYAPLLCNTDYINWQPDLIYFNNSQVCCTPSYYVQKLFMNHQGRYRLECNTDKPVNKRAVKGIDGKMNGKICLAGFQSKVHFSEICLFNPDKNEKLAFPAITAEKNAAPVELMNVNWNSYTLNFKAVQYGEGWGFDILFGMENEDNYHIVKLGGVGNHDAFIAGKINGCTVTYTQRNFHIEAGRTYEITMCVDGGKIEIFVDHKVILSYICSPLYQEQLYYTASKETNGDIIVKLVNVSDNSENLTINFSGSGNYIGKAYIMQNSELMRQLHSIILHR